MLAGGPPRPALQERGPLGYLMGRSVPRLWKGGWGEREKSPGFPSGRSSLLQVEQVTGVLRSSSETACTLGVKLSPQPGSRRRAASRGPCRR